MLAVLAVLAGIYLFTVLSRPSSQISKGSKLELLDLQPLTGAGKPIGPQSLVGAVTLLNFWGTWCPPCRQEFPHTVALAERYRDQADFRLVSVSSPYYADTTPDELKAETLQFLAMQNTTLPTHANPNNKPFVESFPTTVLVDRAGIIRNVWQGYWPGMELEIQEAVELQLARGAD